MQLWWSFGKNWCLCWFLRPNLYSQRRAGGNSILIPMGFYPGTQLVYDVSKYNCTYAMLWRKCVNRQKPAKNRTQKFFEIDYWLYMPATFWQLISGNGNITYVNWLKFPWKNSWNHIKWIYFWRFYKVFTALGTIL